MKEDRTTEHFKQLTARISDIRRSDHGTDTKLSALLAIAEDYDGKVTLEHFSQHVAPLLERGRAGHLTNYLLLRAEAWAMDCQPMTADDLEQLADEFAALPERQQQSLYDNPSYNGTEQTADDEAFVVLPEELHDFKGSSMVVRIANIDAFEDAFSSRDPQYRRAAAMLADIDEEVLRCLDEGRFPQWLLVSYKDDGDAILEFSHFEVDLREPDEHFRTLHVVYRYDSTIS